MQTLFTDNWILSIAILLQVVLQLQCNNGFFTYYWIAMKKPCAMETLIFLIAIVIDQATHDCDIEVCLMFRLDYWRQVNGNVSKKFVVMIKMWSIIKIDEKRTLHFPFSIWQRTNDRNDSKKELFFFLMTIWKMHKTMTIINNISRVFIACRSLLWNPNKYWLLNKV